MSMTITAIHRFPVKGLAADPLSRADLILGDGLPFDRRWAIAHGASAVDPLAPAWAPKGNFLNLAKDEKLAQLGIAFDPETRVLTLSRKGKQVSRGRLDDPTGRALLVGFLSAFLGGGAAGPRGSLRIIEAPAAASFSDVEENWISLINLASVADIERVARQPVDPARFRGNLHLDGAPAWAEREWVGRRLAIGTSVLECVDGIGRCAATEVNPATAERDINLPQTLRRGFGHIECGMYLRVVQAGAIAAGDTVALLD